ncbi:hypothetical protein [Robertkochia sediminum]|uniref:hypothetical protein n=1 Tax=Robertkochia sediminum TaxID=2785326 RepID=UPI00193197DE|nr:hypothetical protein [Robertkochia sediminum]MBL7473309.1 hypothetical protein [Robertkochia sediminum]
MTLNLEYVDAVFKTLQGSDLSQYTLTGVQVLAVLLFLINLLKKYLEGTANTQEVTWGLTPSDLVKNLAIVLLVIFSHEILFQFDTFLVAIETQYREVAPDLVPLQLQGFDLSQDIHWSDVGTKALSTIYEYITTPFYPMRIVAFILSVFLWLLDLIIYPLFLAERFFILGLMQVFFPLILSLSVFEKFRTMGYNFFRLYIAIYMLVPAFFLVNVFINGLFTEANQNFWSELTGSLPEDSLMAPVIELGVVGFMVLLKFKLYRKATSFTLRMFTN